MSADSTPPKGPLPLRVQVILVLVFLGLLIGIGGVMSNISLLYPIGVGMMAVGIFMTATAQKAFSWTALLTAFVGVCIVFGGYAVQHDNPSGWVLVILGVIVFAFGCSLGPKKI